MPWSSESFKKHNKKLRGAAASEAASAANKALDSGKSEGAAVRIGNYVGDRVRAAHARKG